MQVKSFCSICFEKECTNTIVTHWRTGLVQVFTEGTCESDECKKEYDHALAQSDLRESDYEET